MLKHLAKLRGISKRKTTDEQLHAAREKIADMLEKKYNLK